MRPGKNKKKLVGVSMANLVFCCASVQKAFSKVFAFLSNVRVLFGEVLDFHSVTSRLLSVSSREGDAILASS